MVKKQEEKAVFFVEVQRPAELQRNLLQILKEIVEGLHRFEQHKEIRKEKAARIEKLKKVLKQLTKDMVKLKQELPESKLRALREEYDQAIGKVPAKKAKKGKRKIVKKAAPEKPKRASEIQQLEAEIAAIEDKLKSLE